MSWIAVLLVASSCTMAAQWPVESVGRVTSPWAGTGLYADPPVPGVGINVGLGTITGIGTTEDNTLLVAMGTGVWRVNQATAAANPWIGDVSAVIDETTTTLDGPPGVLRLRRMRGPLIQNPRDDWKIVFNDYCKVRSIRLDTGEVHTLVGSPSGVDELGDALGIGFAARFRELWGLARNPGTDAFYVSEDQNHKVHAIVANEATRVPEEKKLLAGDGQALTRDGRGIGSSFNNPRELAFHYQRSHLYVLEYAGRALRRIMHPGRVSTAIAGLDAPMGMTISKDGRFVILGLSGGADVVKYDTEVGLWNTIVNGTVGLGGSHLSFAASVGVPLHLAFSYNNSALFVASNASSIARIAFDEPPACRCNDYDKNITNFVEEYNHATDASQPSIELDKSTWTVYFRVNNVRTIWNGHMLASPVNSRLNATEAFTPIVSRFDEDRLWFQPVNCTLSMFDEPHESLLVDVEFDRSTCIKRYTIAFSLVDKNQQDRRHCVLTDDGQETTINCTLILAATRAFSLMDWTTFVAQEYQFQAELRLSNELNSEVQQLMHATMTKCSVKSFPVFFVDCRVPGRWNFQPSFGLTQNPSGWILADTCEATQTTVATYIRCSISSDAPIADEVQATGVLTARLASAPNDAMNFEIEYLVPRLVNASISASLQGLVTGARMSDGKFFYGTADRGVLQLDVVDSSRVTLTAVALINSAGEEYGVLTEAAFDATQRGVGTTLYEVEFLPSAMRADSDFYRQGPHSIRVELTFVAFRRSGDDEPRRQETAASGSVTLDGLRIGSDGVAGFDEPVSGGSSAGSGTSTRPVLVAGVVIGIVVLVFGAIGAAAVIVIRRRAAKEEPTSGRANKVGIDTAKTGRNAPRTPSKAAGVAQL